MLDYLHCLYPCFCWRKMSNHRHTYCWLINVNFKFFKHFRIFLLDLLIKIRNFVFFIKMVKIFSFFIRIIVFFFNLPFQSFLLVLKLYRDKGGFDEVKDDPNVTCEFANLFRCVFNRCFIDKAFNKVCILRWILFDKFLSFISSLSAWYSFHHKEQILTLHQRDHYPDRNR